MCCLIKGCSTVNDHIFSCSRMSKVNKLVQQDRVHSLTARGLQVKAISSLMEGVFLEQSVRPRTIARWRSEFQMGRRQIIKNAPSGRPQTIKREEVLGFLQAQPTASTRAIANGTGISQSSVWRILREDGKKPRRGTEIPKSLSDRDIKKRVACCEENLLNFSKRNLSRIIAQDEKWIYYDNPSKQLIWAGPGNFFSFILEFSSDDPLPTVVKKNPHGKKVLISFWFRRSGEVFFYLMPEGKTVKAQTIVDELEDVAGKLKSSYQKPVVLFDNARPHVALITQHKLRQLGWSRAAHPPYSPDLSPCDYSIFLGLQVSF